MLAIKETNDKIKRLQEGIELIAKCKKEFNKLKLSSYGLDDIIRDLSEQLKMENCSHNITKVEYTYDSHYDYENTICCDCGKTITSIKI